MSRTLQHLNAAILQSYRDVGGVNHIGGVNLPSRARVARLLAEIEELVFPGFICDDVLTAHNLEYVTGARIARILDVISEQAALNRSMMLGRAVDAAMTADAEAFAVRFVEQVPSLRAALALDVQALFDGDPAAGSREEIILAYPGVRAIVVHRVAHFFWQHELRMLARMMSEVAHGLTGIDIHPGARIGHHFYIDHGTGVVIGETTVIGDHVKLYQGVSLGALSVSKKLQDNKRHPTIEDHVTIYAGATILGGETVVGHHSVIGGNTWLVKSVPPFSVVEREAVVKVGSRDRGDSFDPVI